MGKEIYNDIIKAKSRKCDSIESIINCFEPQINKYARLLNGDDTRQELIIYIIKTINTIPINEGCIWNDKSILSYISKSVKNEYIKLSKKEHNIKKVELDLCNELESEYFEEDFSFIELFKELTEKECYIIKLIYIYGFSVVEIAQTMKITRQAVNKSKK